MMSPPTAPTFKPIEGVLLVNKEEHFSSFSLIKLLRRLTQVQKIGHTGTLDPLATGLMIFLLGRKYTSQANSWIGLDKDYKATLFLGKSTDTYDREGRVVFSSDFIPTLAEVNQTLPSFQGKIWQTPPSYSAKKIQGKKYYELARKGILLSPPPQLVEMQINLLSYQYPYLHLFITCSKGTYIRSLAQDIGDKLTCGAHLHQLIRTRIGSYHLKDSTHQQKLHINSPWHTLLQTL